MSKLHEFGLNTFDYDTCHIKIDASKSVHKVAYISSEILFRNVH